MSISTNSSVVIHLDSRFSTQLETGLTTNFIYNLIEPIEIPNHESCEVSLYTATIPYSFYNVRTNINDSILITYLYDTVSVADVAIATINLTPGNYSANGLIKEIKLQISKSSDSHIKILTFTHNYTRETLKFTLTLDQTLTGTQALSFDFINSGNLFGFPNGVQNFTINSNVGTLKSTQCIDINDNVHGLYIRQNLTTKSTLDNEAGTFSNILARIPINTNPGGIIYHTPSDGKHKALTSLHSIQTIGIKLTDDSNNTIDLNGLHFQISLLISFVARTIPMPRRRVVPIVEPIPKLKSKPKRKTKSRRKKK